MVVTRPPPAAPMRRPSSPRSPDGRQLVAEVPSIPDLLAEQDWLSLEDDKRAAHDEDRLEHHSRLVVVQTPVIGRVVKRGGDLIRMNRLARYGRSGLMVSGPTRAGKTGRPRGRQSGSSAAVTPPMRKVLYEICERYALTGRSRTIGVAVP